MNTAFLTALERIEREKGIDREILFEAIESALVSAARKVIDSPDISKEDIEVSINRSTGEIEVYSEGDVIESERFGRIAAQTAKQVIIQKIREAEREVVFDKYEKKISSIVSGSVHRFEKGNIVVELDDAEAILPKREQLSGERFRQGEHIRAYILEVNKNANGPEIILSRSAAGFVKKLFELEVPEITQGIVEIKSIAREAGERTKIAVNSKDEKVDPVGACVGMRGSRVRDIVKELNGERIDIVRWDDDIRAYLPAAVSPAEIQKIVIDRDNGTIKLTVPRDQLSLLIGKKGRNIRLASKLLGWDLLAEAAKDQIGAILSDVKAITKKAKEALVEYGYDDVNKILELGEDGLKEVEGIGEKTAQKIYKACETLYNEIIENRDKELAAVKVKEEAEEKAKEEAKKMLQAEIQEAAQEENDENVAETDEKETGEEKQDVDSVVTEEATEEVSPGADDGEKQEELSEADNEEKKEETSEEDSEDAEDVEDKKE